MRNLLAVFALMLVSVSAFAVGDPGFDIPEPESLALVAVAIAGMLATRRIKK